MKFTIVVVLYNTKAEESLTLKTLAGDLDSNDQLIIWDNSPTQLTHDFNFLETGNYVYKKSRENKPLGNIYSIVFRLSKKGYILLLDQDSVLENGFLKKVKEYTAEYPHQNLLLPLVYFRDTIVSPGFDYFGKGSLWKNKRLGTISSSYITAINSGMIIKASYANQFLANGGYHRGLRFYGVDKYFMKQYRKRNANLAVLDLKIDHDSGLRNVISTDDLLRRFKDQINAWKILYSDNLFLRLMLMVKILTSKFKYAIVYKTTKFLF